MGILKALFAALALILPSAVFAQSQSSATLPVGNFVTVNINILSGGVSQTIFTRSEARRYLFCQNPISATEPLYINIDAPANTTGGSWEIAPGGTWQWTSSVIPVGQVNVTATTTNHTFTCKQGYFVQ